MEPPDCSEHELVELKAKVESLDFARKKLKAIRARHVGTFKQKDVYFVVPKGRLKLRTVQGEDRALLIYYEREDIPSLKSSNVFLLELQRPAAFKKLFEKILGKKMVIAKTREIYLYEGTQIHLDRVRGLGTFIEFERKTEQDPEARHKDREALERLMKMLAINSGDLLTGSYSDMIQSPNM